MTTFDYVIVGAGSAGCVLANRLSESGKHSVCVLEAGGSDSSIYIQMPSAVAIPMVTEKYIWNFQSEPEPHLNGRRIPMPRGRVLGGCSSINGMVYMRGHPSDFDTWERLGCVGWGYADVLPYFRKSESRLEGGDTWRGDSGPLSTRYGTLKNPLYKAFISAGKQAGYPVSEDLNGFQQEGFGKFDMTVRNGIRWSTSRAYLKPAMNRKNMRVECGAEIQRINVENGIAKSVTFVQGGKSITVAANREVLLCAGPLNSPKILMLSGVGDEDELRVHGILPKKHLPGVGKNLQDHLSVYMQFTCKQPITLNGLNWFSKLKLGAEWILRKKGLGATNHFECGAFIRSKPGVQQPDIEIHFLPIAVREKGDPRFEEHGFQVDVGPTKSLSNGHVKLKSKDPSVPPEILFNYMSNSHDWEEMRSCVDLVREIVDQKAFDEFRGVEAFPGPNCKSSEQIDDFIANNVQSGYHPCGTCKMGSTSDETAVVDSELRVIGVQNLRVVDSSVIPVITNANLNAPTIMIAEKAADHILGNTVLPPIFVDYFVSKTWAFAQR